MATRKERMIRRGSGRLRILLWDEFVVGGEGGGGEKVAGLQV